MILIKFDDRGVSAALREIESQVKDRTKLMDKAGKTIRDYVRETIKMQGRKPWAPMTKSSRQTSGRYKLFTSVGPDIVHQANNERFVVFFNRRTVGWTLEMHQKGFRVPYSRGIVMMIPNGLGKARNAAGRFTGGSVGPKFFTFRYPFNVPAREIWPSRPEVIYQVNEVLRQWLHDLQKAAQVKYRQNGGT
jgi:hypothetical protein